MSISLLDVYKVYRPTRDVEVVALRGVTLTVERGEIVALMGPSGSGKTTALNIMGTLDRPTRGRVMVAGIDVTEAEEGFLEALRLHYIGFVFQNVNLVPSLTALENVALPMLAAGYPRYEAYRKARLLLDAVEVADRAGHYPHQLSGGQQQRVAIARALANMPLILILDEPTSNVDVATTRALLALFREINRSLGTTIVMATHDPEVASIAGRVVYMRGGVVSRSAVKIAEIAEGHVDVERVRERMRQVFELERELVADMARRNELVRWKAELLP